MSLAIIISHLKGNFLFFLSWLAELCENYSARTVIILLTCIIKVHLPRNSPLHDIQKMRTSIARDHKTETGDRSLWFGNGVMNTPQRCTTHLSSEKRIGITPGSGIFSLDQDPDASVFLFCDSVLTCKHCLICQLYRSVFQSFRERHTVYLNKVPARQLWQNFTFVCNFNLDVSPFFLPYV